MTVGDLAFLFKDAVLLGGGVMLGWGIRKVWQAPWVGAADELASMARLVVSDPAREHFHMIALAAVVEQWDYLRGKKQ